MKQRHLSQNQAITHLQTTMELKLILSALLALEVASKSIRGAKRATRKRRGVDKALKRCYPIFLEYEDCLMSAYYQYDCEDLRNDFFECMAEESDFNMNCGTPYSTNASQTIEQKSSSSSSFGTEMFVQLCLANPRSNVLFSPLSVYRSLELLEDGATASSKCRAELDDLLGPRELREQVKVLQEFDTRGDVQLNLATSVWANELKDSYITHLTTEHSADAFDLPQDFSPIDSWIENKTNGMIKELMGSGKLDDLTVALLVDAVYFRGNWAYKFEPEENIKNSFYHRDGMQGEEATFMTAIRPMEVIEESSTLGGASGVILDYNDDEAQISALFVLPKSTSDESMNEVINGLNLRPLPELLDEATEVTVKLELPRFHLDFPPTKLKEFLKNMGMSTSFDKDVVGKFNRMSHDTQLYIEEIHHSACLDIYEAGTEASAATVVVANTRSKPRVPPMKLTFDRPFVVVIVHKSSGIPLFLGKVETPYFT